MRFGQRWTSVGKRPLPQTGDAVQAPTRSALFERIVRVFPPVLEQTAVSESAERLVESPMGSLPLGATFLAHQLRQGVAMQPAVVSSAVTGRHREDLDFDRQQDTRLSSHAFIMGRYDCFVNRGLVRRAS